MVIKPQKYYHSLLSDDDNDDNDTTKNKKRYIQVDKTKTETNELKLH